MKLLYSLFFLFFAVTLSAAAQQVPKLRIDPAHAFGGTVSEYFDSVEYIPLETTKESLFGYIVQMVVTDSSYIISDFDTRCVFFFNKKGKFLTKTKVGIGYPTIEYNELNKCLLVRSFNNRNKPIKKYYSVLGKQLEKAPYSIKIPKSRNIVSLGKNYYLAPKTCLIEKGKQPIDSLIYLAEIYYRDSLYKSFIPMNQSKNLAACAFSYKGFDVRPSMEEGIAYMAVPITHEVYKITKDTAVKLYKIVFPMKKSITLKALKSSNFPYLDSLRGTDLGNPNIVLSVGNIFKFQSLLFFKTTTINNGYDRNIKSDDTYNFIYNLNTRKLSCVERIVPDASNGYLPFYSWNIKIFGLNYNKSDSCFYSQVSSLEMFNAYIKNKDKKPNYPPNVSAFFKSQSRKSNPIIIKFKLKTQNQ